MSILKARGYRRIRQKTISWLYHFPLGLESLLSVHVSFETDVGHLGASFSITLTDLYTSNSQLIGASDMCGYIRKRSGNICTGKHFLYSLMTYLGKWFGHSHVPIALEMALAVKRRFVLDISASAVS